MKEGREGDVCVAGDIRVVSVRTNEALDNRSFLCLLERPVRFCLQPRKPHSCYVFGSG